MSRRNPCVIHSAPASSFTHSHVPLHSWFCVDCQKHGAWLERRGQAQRNGRIHDLNCADNRVSAGHPDGAGIDYRHAFGESFLDDIDDSTNTVTTGTP